MRWEERRRIDCIQVLQPARLHICFFLYSEKGPRPSDRGHRPGAWAVAECEVWSVKCGVWACGRAYQYHGQLVVVCDCLSRIRRLLGYAQLQRIRWKTVSPQLSKAYLGTDLYTGLVYDQSYQYHVACCYRCTVRCQTVCDAARNSCVAGWMHLVSCTPV